MNTSTWRNLFNEPPRLSSAPLALLQPTALKPSRFVSFSLNVCLHVSSTCCNCSAAPHDDLILLDDGWQNDCMSTSPVLGPGLNTGGTDVLC